MNLIKIIKENSFIIDVISQNLYWTDSIQRTVEVMSLETGARIILMKENDRLLDIVLAPEMSIMFIAQVGNRGGSILKASMDGKNRKVLAHMDGHPSAISYSRDTQHIFWYTPVRNFFY